MFLKVIEWGYGDIEFMNEKSIKIDLKWTKEDFSLDLLNKEVLDIVLSLLKVIECKIVITFQELIKTLTKYPNIKIEEALEELEKAEILQKIIIAGDPAFSLTHRGKILLNNHFKETSTINEWKKESGESSSSLNAEREVSYLPEEYSQLENLNYTPSFIGCFIADKSGKSLLVFELYEGAIENYLKIQRLETFDKELIPMMVSALEHFSREINIRQLSGLILEGKNIKLQTYNYDKFTVSFLMNPKTNTKSIEKEMNNYFESLFNDYQQELELSMRTGFVDNINHLNKLGREMLKELNKFVYLAEFKNIVCNSRKFDMIYAKTLYSKLDQLQKNLDFKFTLNIEKLKQLKIYLLKAMLDENFEELKFIITVAQEIESEFN